MADMQRQLPGASEDEVAVAFDVSTATSWQTGLPPGALSAG
ncbi:MAG: hypothetical protein Q8L14_33705 [Myxococcales bacterium]|nr:hypothetical protein [Myxococcales bacterium]